MHAESEEPSARGKSEPEFSYFQIQALWGVTKHMGGLKATEQLAELCHIDKEKYALEVSCGIGTTAGYLAKRHGCTVVGVDISEKMVEWAQERAKRAGLQERVEFRVADAHDLPFEDALFDAVVSESVTAFPEDKQKVVSEYVRVTKPGGYIGLNEGTWVNPQPPPELVNYIGHTMAGAKFLTSDGWKDLLEGSGLRDITMRT